jgi:hypothetical protein
MRVAAQFTVERFFIEVGGRKRPQRGPFCRRYSAPDFDNGAGGFYTGSPGIHYQSYGRSAMRIAANCADCGFGSKA